MADRRRNLGIPSGVVFPFAGTSAPYGYLVCDGSAISRSDYPALFTALGTSHGSGDGSTTFNLPDYRGRFLRGVDGTAGNDPDKASRTHPVTGIVVGNVVGSVQNDAMQGHYHNNRIRSDGSGSGDGRSIVFTSNADETLVSNGNDMFVDSPKSDGVNGTPRTTSESRPKNVNVNYIIKV